MSFGTYSPFAATTPVMNLGEVSVTCTRQFLQDIGATVNPIASISAGSSGNPANRSLRSGSDLLLYALYADAAGQTRWTSQGVAMPAIRLPALTLSAISRISVFGSVSALQNARPGAYADNLTVTVAY